MQDRKTRGELPVPIAGELRLPPVEVLADDIGGLFRDPPDNFFLGLLMGIALTAGMAAVLACLWAIRPW